MNLKMRYQHFNFIGIPLTSSIANGIAIDFSVSSLENCERERDGSASVTLLIYNFIWMSFILII